MSAEDHKAAHRRWIEAYNDRDDEGEADARTSGYIAHVPGAPAPLSSEEWVQFIGGFSDGFPDLRLAIEDVVADGDMLAARVSFHGTHTGEFQGIPPTNREVAFSSIELNRFEDGRVAEHWVEINILGVLQQLGVAPAGPGA